MGQQVHVHIRAHQEIGRLMNARQVLPRTSSEASTVVPTPMKMALYPPENSLSTVILGPM